MEGDWSEACGEYDSINQPKNVRDNGCYFADNNISNAVGSKSVPTNWLIRSESAPFAARRELRPEDVSASEASDTMRRRATLPRHVTTLRSITCAFFHIPFAERFGHFDCNHNSGGYKGSVVELIELHLSINPRHATYTRRCFYSSGRNEQGQKLTGCSEGNQKSQYGDQQWYVLLPWIQKTDLLTAFISAIQSGCLL